MQLVEDIGLLPSLQPAPAGLPGAEPQLQGQELPAYVVVEDVQDALQAEPVRHRPRPRRPLRPERQQGFDQCPQVVIDGPRPSTHTIPNGRIVTSVTPDQDTSTRSCYELYELALDTARKAERALRNELGDPSLTFVRPSYLVGPEGLLAGEKLHLDIRRMEVAQLDLNRREYELTKHISLLQADPWALVALRATGRCTFTVPEELLDLDTPGHYFRRIRSVSLSVPCVTGPYTGVACTVRLLRSRVRTSPLPKDGEYAPVADGEDRFENQLGATEAVVTSSGNNDSGLFDPGAGDGRLLPFEYRGVVSEWQLELPDGPRPFDYDTITDIVLHVRYTARDGGQALRDRAGAHLRDLLAEGTAAGSVRLLSVRHEFPTAWARFVGSKAGNGSSERQPRAELKLPLRAEHYPFFAGTGPAGLTNVVLVARSAGAEQQLLLADRAWDRENPNDEADKKTRAVKLTGRPDLNGLLRGALRDDPAIPGKRAWGDLPEPTGSFSLYSEKNTIKDLFVLLTWSAKDPAL